MTDLSIFDLESRAESGFTVHITHPASGKKTGLSVNVVGVDSKTYADAQKQMLAELKDDDADKEAAGIRLLAKCTRDWSGFEEDGKELKFSVKEAEQVYSKYKGIREQVDRGMAQRSRLFSESKEG